MRLTNRGSTTNSGYKMRDWEKAFLGICIFISIIAVLWYAVPWLLSLSNQMLPNYDLEITVLGADAEPYENSFYDYGYVFTFNVKIENTGNAELTVSYGNFYILTKSRRVISSTWTEGTVFLEELPAGTWTSGKIAFKFQPSEFPTDDELDKLVFEKELFGDDIYFEWKISDLG